MTQPGRARPCPTVHVHSDRSPTGLLLIGLAVTLLSVALYSGYTISQLNSLRRLQIETIDRNRADSLLLLRIQNDLNSLALTMRDMLDSTEPYPLTAWHGQFQRIRADLEDALTRETHFPQPTVPPINSLPGELVFPVLGWR